MTTLYPIQVSQYAKSSPKTELFCLLEQLLPIKFVFGEQNEIKAAAIIGPSDRASVNGGGVPSLSLPLSAESANKSRQIDSEVEFSDDPDVPFPFRGRKVIIKMAQVKSALSVGNNEKVLATSKQGPIWLMSEIEGVKHFKSVLPLPDISVNESFHDIFNGECFLETLVLLQFVRGVIGKTAYQNPPLRASFIIDDPNLHWPKYGFITYKNIITHAQKENFHVSFATIPLDTWFTHAATADLFRANSRWLSLLIHGNNHGKKELALNYSESMRKALLQQAIMRINRLEQRANLDICRVMVPPHGACSEEMLAELPQCGFESACISAGSLRAHNQDKPWTKTLGFFPSEVIRGCPVLPRWGLTGNVRNNLLLASYLGQPMILRGHHQDLKNGPEIFDEYAQFINSLGEVVWSSMSHLSRMNYLWKVEGTQCRVKPLGRNTVFEVPDEVTELIIERSNVVDEGIWQVIAANGRLSKIRPGERLLLTDEMCRKISVERNALRQSSSDATRFQRTSLALILRRLLSEGRDRLLLS
jgi:hypothetical protein